MAKLTYHELYYERNAQIPDWIESGYYVEGWRGLLEQLHKDLIEITPHYRVAQVKEKFGGLRCYLGPLPPGVFDAAHKLVDKAESESYKICETCGKPGRLRNKGWARTLCDKHAKEQGYVD